jgi:glycosyltransferase involved in cell wall biosynthesis
MTKICHITSVHSWDDSRIFHKECVSLASAGYEVTLLVANGITDVINDVKVINVPIGKKGRLQRFAFAGTKMLEKALSEKADIYHLHDPELLLIATKLKKRTGAAVIFDAHEDLPKQIMDKTWIPVLFRKMISKFAYRFELKIAAKIDGIVSVTENICTKFKLVNKHVELVANFPRLNEIEQYSSNESISKIPNSICYVGSLFRTRGIKELVNAISKTNATLLLAGKFTEKDLENEIKSLDGWKQVHFFGYLDRKGIVELLQKSQIGMVTLHPTKSYKESLPIKLFEYMLAKLPIISSDFEYWNPLVNGNNCGLMVDPLDTDAIAEKINFLLDNPELCLELGNNGYKAVTSNYSWESQAKNLLNLYAKVVKH